MKKCKQWISLMLMVTCLLTVSAARAEITLKLNGVSTRFSGDFTQ